MERRDKEMLARAIRRVADGNPFGGVGDLEGLADGDIIAPYVHAAIGDALRRIADELEGGA